jgi:hypothetical protein
MTNAMPNPAHAEVVRRLLAQRAEQGLPPTIEDPAVIGLIAQILLQHADAARREVRR